jgi:hypothetical protein
MSGIFDTGIFDTNIFDHAVQTTGGVGYWPEPPKKKYRVYPEYDPDAKQDTDAKPKRKRKKKKQEGQEIVLAPDPVIETGIVTVRPAWDAMAELQRIADEAAFEQRNRLMALLRADDEWLMSL